VKVNAASSSRQRNTARTATRTATSRNSLPELLRGLPTAVSIAVANWQLETATITANHNLLREPLRELHYHGCIAVCQLHQNATPTATLPTTRTVNRPPTRKRLLNCFEDSYPRRPQRPRYCNQNQRQEPPREPATKTATQDLLPALLRGLPNCVASASQILPRTATRTATRTAAQNSDPKLLRDS